MNSWRVLPLSMWYVIVHIPFGELIVVRHYIRCNKEPLLSSKTWLLFSVTVIMLLLKRGDAKKIKKRVMYGAIWQIWVTAEFCPDLEQPFLKNATCLNRLELHFFNRERPTNLYLKLASFKADQLPYRSSAANHAQLKKNPSKSQLKKFPPNVSWPFFEKISNWF